MSVRPPRVCFDTSSGGTPPSRASPGRGSRSRERTPSRSWRPFFAAFDVLFEPSEIPRAPLGRSLGRYAGMVGMPLGDVLAAITGKDRDALIAGMTTAFPMTFETVDTADLHVIAGAIGNDADELISNDRRTLALDPIGSMRVRTAGALAEALGLIAQGTTIGPSPLVAPS